MRQRGFIFTPMIVYAIAGAVIIAALGGAFWKLTSDADSRGYARAKAECEEASRLQREAEIGQANMAATGLEKGNEKARVVYRTITRTVDRYIDRPVYRNICFDADGLRDANAALEGKSAAVAEPDSRVPEPLPAVGRAGRDGAP